MKRTLLLLAIAPLALSLSSCSSTTEVPQNSLSSTFKSQPNYTIQNSQASVGPQYSINGVALHHYSPTQYTPFAYDHRGGSHETYYRQKALREGTVEVGRIQEGQ